MSGAFVMPRPVGGSATGWTLVDFRSPQARTAPAAGGTCRVDFGQLGSDELWLLDHSIVTCTSTAPTTLRLYSTPTPSDSGLLDGSAAGNFDVADWTGLQVSPGSTLLAVWTGADDGSIGVITLQLRMMRRLA